jgi:hypothetical protein
MQIETSRIVLAILMASTPALAQAPEAPPRALAGIEGLSLKGEVAGMRAWGLEADGMLWLHDPETGVVIAGFPFSEEGASLNPDHAGRDDLTLDAFMAANGRPYEPPVSLDDQGQVSVEIPRDMVEGLEARLARLDPDAYEAAIRDLIAAVRDVATEEDFRAAAAAWIETLPMPEDRGDQVEAEPVTIADSSDGALSSDAENPRVEETADASSGAEGTETSSPDAQAPDVVAADDADAMAAPLIDAMREAFWIPIGISDAPVVYMLSDPYCGPCAAGLVELSPAVAAGEIQVRYLPIPVASEDSTGVIAGILTSPDPAKALLDDAAGFGTEGHAPPFARFSALDEAVGDAVRRNHATAVGYEIPQIPFFAFMTADGPRYISGAAALSQFEGALPEPDPE